MHHEFGVDTTGDGAVLEHAEEALSTPMPNPRSHVKAGAMCLACPSGDRPNATGTEHGAHDFQGGERRPPS